MFAYLKFRRIADPIGLAPGYKAYRCHLPGQILRGFLKSVTKADDGSQVLEPDQEQFTSTPDPSRLVDSILFIREDAIIPTEFLDLPNTEAN